ncbi:MAG: DUF5060 domain-containing protein [Myxococcota bacterium]|nr:DUF5060 domain-containing protein [Myxococcota bacterium]
MIPRCLRLALPLCGLFLVECSSNSQPMNPAPDAGDRGSSGDSSAAAETSVLLTSGEGSTAPSGGDGGDDAASLGTILGTPDGSDPAASEAGFDAAPRLGDGGPSSSEAGLPVTAGGAWAPQELTFTSTANKANPYMDVADFKVTFTGPGGTVLTVPGFYTGNSVWKVRFSPTVAGTFTYATSSAQDASLNGLTGTVPPAPVNPNSHGALRVDPAHPHHYLYADGTHYFQMGYEVDWLGLLDFGDPNITKAKTLIDMMAANGFNEVLMQAYAYDTAWKPGITSVYDFGPPREFAWAGTNATADNTRMNEAYWQSYDRVIAYLFQKGITAHIYFKYVRTYGANMLVSWPAHNTPAEDMYFRFLTARYQAYPNVTWNLMKESYHEPDQVYLANRFDFIKANDAYHRLRTIHDSDGGSGQISPNYYDVPSHAGTFDFYTDQQNSNHYAYSLAALKKRAVPYMNAEVTFYQIGNDGTFAYKGDPKEKVFGTNMEVLMAGGYFAYYYSNQAWDIVRWDETPNGIAWYKNLAAFMKTTGWYKMAAADALIGGGAIGTHCLADPGKEYIVYTGAGSVTLNVAGAAAPLNAKWVDLYTGAQSPLPPQSDGAHTFTNPWPNPAMLYLGP